MKSEILTDDLARTPLKTRLRVINRMALMDVLSEFGCLWDGDDKSANILNRIDELTTKLTTTQLTEIKQWETDGRPE